MTIVTINLSYIKSLPLEIEDIIKSFIPISVLLTLNKQYYVKYHKHIKQNTQLINVNLNVSYNKYVEGTYYTI